MSVAYTLTGVKGNDDDDDELRWVSHITCLKLLILDSTYFLHDTKKKSVLRISFL